MRKLMVVLQLLMFAFGLVIDNEVLFVIITLLLFVNF